MEKYFCTDENPVMRYYGKGQIHLSKSGIRRLLDCIEKSNEGIVLVENYELCAYGDPLQRMVDKTGTEETLGHILKGGVEDRKHQRARIEQPVFVVLNVLKQTIQHFSFSTKLKLSVMIVDFWVTSSRDVRINKRQAMMPQF